MGRQQNKIDRLVCVWQGDSVAFADEPPRARSARDGVGWMRDYIRLQTKSAAGFSYASGNKLIADTNIPKQAISTSATRRPNGRRLFDWQYRQ